MSFLILTACNNSKENEKTSDHYVYYIDKDETKLISKPYKQTATTTDELVKEYLTALSSNQEDFSIKKAIPESVMINKYNINDDGQLTIDFDSKYSSMGQITEILCRAAIVKTLSQIGGIKYILFTVNDQPLMNSSDKPVGVMTSNDFIDSTSNNYQKANITLFFANKKGDKLVESNLRVTYDGTISMEQLIIEQLIQGPIEEGQYPTIPSNTSLIKVITKNEICYVDFNKEFLVKVPNITDEVAIYSVVNSLIELSNVSKVRISIDGVQKKTYRETIPLDVFFERNLDIVQTK